MVGFDSSGNPGVGMIHFIPKNDAFLPRFGAVLQDYAQDQAQSDCRQEKREPPATTHATQTYHTLL